MQSCLAVPIHYTLDVRQSYSSSSKFRQVTLYDVLFQAHSQLLSVIQRHCDTAELPLAFHFFAKK